MTAPRINFLNPALLTRLVLDLAAACLLLFAMAYYWQGNAAHEIAGTALFLLLISHNVFNRRRYTAFAKRAGGLRQKIDMATIFLLATAMLTLLITSLMISETVFGVLLPRGDFNARQVHTLAAYWVLVIVSVHLGMRWSVILAAGRRLFRIDRPNLTRTLVLRAVAVCLAIQGVFSSFELSMGTQLAMQITLDWWNFEESAIGFFLHCIAVSGLYIALTYGIIGLMERRGFQLSN
jgi:hypothetical protein